MKPNPTTPHYLERGQSLTELSITMTLLLILLAGVADIGRAFFTYITLRDAAQEGALYGSFAFSDTQPGGAPNSLISPSTACARIQTRLVENSDQPVDLASEAVTSIQIGDATNGYAWASCSDAIAIQPCAGDRLQVSVTYPDFPLTTPFLGALIGTQTVDITASVEDIILAPAGSQTTLCP